MGSIYTLFRQYPVIVTVLHDCMGTRNQNVFLIKSSFILQPVNLPWITYLLVLVLVGWVEMLMLVKLEMILSKRLVIKLPQ
jgi:hypothetical protein